MKKFFTYAAIACLVAFIAAMLALAHRNRQEQRLPSVNPAFREYVGAFTSGIVPAQAAIRVRLAGDYADSASLRLPPEGSLFSFSPAITGKTGWSDSRTLEFRPDGPLPRGTVFRAEFHLSRLMSVPDSLATLVFGFRTMEQELSVEVVNHQACSHRDLSREHLDGILRTSDAADAVQVEKTLTASQDGRALPVTWSHDAVNRAHGFRVDSVMRGDRPGSVRLAWNGSTLDSDDKGEATVEIPRLGDFKALGCSSDFSNGQCITVRFSDPLKPGQDLEGLFRVGILRNLRYDADDNLLRIYLPESNGEKMHLVCEPSIRNINDVPLGRKFTETVEVESAKPAVRFAGDGVILPGDNGMLLPFEAVNLKAVDIKVVRIFSENILQFLQVNELADNSELARVGRVVLKRTMPLAGVTDYGKWNRYSIDLSGLIRPDPGAIYTVILRFKRAYSAYPCGGQDTLSTPAPELASWEDPDGENDANWNYYSNYSSDEEENGGWRNYRWQERDDPCKPSYYYYKSVTRNVFASNLGMIAKSGSDGAWRVFVTNLVTARPVAGAAVEFLDFQLRRMGKTVTDGDGMAAIILKKRPLLAMARAGHETGYLKLSEGNSLSLSMFDVGGEPVQKGIKGFIYGERGVWRPGDSIYLTFVLDDRARRLPPGHPVSMTLFNPAGQPVGRIVNKDPLNGFFRFGTATSADAPTGNWMAKVNVGGVEFRKNIRIETVKPNRLKISFGFGRDRLVAEQAPPAVLEAKWLTGATAGNLKARVLLTLSKSATAFPGFPGFIFDNPTVGFAPENITIFDGRLNAAGRATVAPDIHITHVAPGALKATFETLVFEEGGEFSADRFSVPYFPYLSYAGLGIPAEENRILNTDKTYDIRLVNLDAGGRPVVSGRLKTEVFRLEWRWWWDDSEGGPADFISTSYIRPSDSAVLTTVNGRATFPFRVDHDDWGRYLIRVTDLKSGHAAGKVIWVDWPGYSRAPGSEKQAAAMLTLTTDKSRYRVGEKIRITVPSSPDGRALVSVENGTRVLRSLWVPTLAGSTVITLDATPEMSPNCYVFTTLIQPHAQSKNDLPVRLYGVVPVLVENPGTHLKPVIAMRSELEPGAEAAVTVSEASGKPMTYTVAIVDEGLLDLTRFKTPDPWDAFYAKEALGVRTWDLFDQVMGAFSGELQRILAIGGDREEMNRSGVKANRFKPVVRFAGPFSVKAGEKRTHKIKIPEYIGSVRVMVVAGQDGAYGSAEKAVPVKKPLMVLGTMPRMLAPGEELSLPVTVFSMDPSIRDVKVEITVNDLFAVKGGHSKSVAFHGTGDRMTGFTLSTAMAAGTGRVSIVATGGKFRAEHTIEIAVRNPNPPVTRVYEKAIRPGAVWATPLQAPGVPGTNNSLLELSSISPLNLENRLSYLVQYPYGCIEQTVSSAFPQLYLAQLAEIPEAAKKEAEQNIRAAIRKLASLRLSNGGLAYWPGASEADDWGTSYAGHFLLAAEREGFSMPIGFLSPWKEFQRQKAVSWNVNASRVNNDLAQAYRLFTLALAQAPELGAMNLLMEKKDLSPAARWQLAAAYQLAGRREAALRLINRAPEKISPYRELDGSYGSDLRDNAMIAMTLCLLDMKTKAAPLVKEISSSLCSDAWYNTQATSFALMAVAEFTRGAGGNGILATLQQDAGRPVEMQSPKPVMTRSLEIPPDLKGVVRVTNRGKNILFARVIATGIPPAADTTSVSSGLTIRVAWKTTAGNVLAPWKLVQGTPFITEVTVVNPGLRGAYRNLALSQVFPSGWEILSSGGEEAGQPLSGSSAFTYQDIRDDRVNTFFDLAPNESKTFRIRLMAAYAGKYILPAAVCEAMYDHSITARSPGRRVEVVEEE